jgi:hypothetical protein
MGQPNRHGGEKLIVLLLFRYTSGKKIFGRQLTLAP